LSINVVREIPIGASVAARRGGRTGRFDRDRDLIERLRSDVDGGVRRGRRNEPHGPGVAAGARVVGGERHVHVTGRELDDDGREWVGVAGLALACVIAKTRHENGVVVDEHRARDSRRGLL
jgi:hypothetical protein